MFCRIVQLSKVAILSLLLISLVAGCSNAAPAAQDAAAPTNTSAVEQAAATDTPAPAAEATATEAPKAESAAADTQPAAASQTFVIDGSQSQARFHIFEELRGSPKTVEGVTTIEGSVALDPANLAAAKIGEIKIDARSFKTDSGMRDGAIRRFILGSNDDDHRYISFTPTAISGLPASAKAGDTLNFQVTGDLKIYETVKPVTFAMTVTAQSDVELSGSGSTTVLRSDFGLSIPSVPGVANVGDEVSLFIDFTAKPQQ